MERNTLMAKCYPRIKDYCREKHGLEFQVNIIYAPIVLDRIHWHTQIINAFDYCD